MKRPARLQSARSWLEKYPGKNVVRGYRKRFGVDLVCAYKELEILGIRFDPSVVAASLKSAAGAAVARRRKKAERAERPQPSPYGEMYVDWDDNFAYIAGFTPGGAPFGITWEEMRRIEMEDAEALKFFGLTPVALYGDDGEQNDGEQDDYDDEYIDEEICVYTEGEEPDNNIPF
jgi:hypothetical protein